MAYAACFTCMQTRDGASFSRMPPSPTWAPAAARHGVVAADRPVAQPIRAPYVLVGSYTCQ
eukprot:gene5816-5737_t